ncbi:hypothetical protein NRI_0542 [Neorickettsia risticii str. Illinois]|uniref:Uncharacterized protein n=1 Tax=Neorickettsia risticii (strain Illinois) TaxID=434131 RepID=C6V554_NEORI|nr:hypothetical protein NRI_0542 [Neorickettsia risticii str. Illinois]
MLLSNLKKPIQIGVEFLAVYVRRIVVSAVLSEENESCGFVKIDVE